MEYRDFVHDFAERTLKNLDHVQAQARAGHDVYPVTQLWNSLLGLVVVLRERDFKRVPATRMAALRAEGWPELRFSDTQPKSLRELVIFLRNAVTHFNVDFRSTDHEISSVIVWGHPTNPDGSVDKSRRVHEVSLTVDDLDGLGRHIANVYLRAFGSRAA